MSTRRVLSRGLASPAALDWSAKQARILTGGGRAEKLYTAERGFPFTEEELPHHHLLHGTTRLRFREWLEDGRTCDSIVGAWKRLVFTNGVELSNNTVETVFNVQTRGYFVDLRVPTARPSFNGARSIDALSAEQLRLLARQHVFCGYTLSNPPSPSSPLVCTRHHAIDWNFVGVKRPRPNKWTVEEVYPEKGAPIMEWEEHSFARDDYGMSYYMERWVRLDGDGHGSGPSLVLRSCLLPDAFILLVGDHFAFARAREGCPLVPPGPPQEAPASLVALVDSAIERGDLESARLWLGLVGGHGRASSGWRIDLSTHPWLEGTQLLQPGAVTGAIVGGHAVGEVHADVRAAALEHGADDLVVIDGKPWEVVDRTGLEGAEDVLHVLRA